MNILKLRSKSKQFYKKAIGNGQQTLFWFEPWSVLSSLFDLLGDLGVTDLEISRTAIVAEVLSMHRRRTRHHTDIVIEVEKDIVICKEKHRPSVEDTH